MTLLHADHVQSDTLLSAIGDVLLDAVLDTLKLLPFLFLTYLLMEYVEHKAQSKLNGFVKRAGALGPLAGGAVGLIPQCGFSTVASNLYSAKVITLGTLISVFLCTSDEMLPILISGNVGLPFIITVLLYKALCGISVGFLVNLILYLSRRTRPSVNIDAICEGDDCHCEKGILNSAIHHTLSIGIFILIVSILINAVIALVGQHTLASLIYNKPVLSHIIGALIGLIPNCASSVLLTQLCVEGVISAGTMISGLLSGAGVGLAVLIRVNKSWRENLIIITILFCTGVIFGIVADLIGLSDLLVLHSTT